MLGSIGPLPCSWAHKRKESNKHDCKRYKEGQEDPVPLQSRRSIDHAGNVQRIEYGNVITHLGSTATSRRGRNKGVQAVKQPQKDSRRRPAATHCEVGDRFGPNQVSIFSLHQRARQHHNRLHCSAHCRGRGSPITVMLEHYWAYLKINTYTGRPRRVPPAPSDSPARGIT
jgi:hypothetical protein